MTAPAETKVTAELWPADVALPDGRVYERVLVLLTTTGVTVWQASPAHGGDPYVAAALVWSGRRELECTVPAAGTFTVVTDEGPLEVTWGGEPR